MPPLSPAPRQGNTCYINSIVQCLFATRQLRDALMSPTTTSEMASTNGSVAGLSRLFSQLASAKGPVNTSGITAFTDALASVWSQMEKNPALLPFQQEDAHEFLITLMEELREDLEG